VDSVAVLYVLRQIDWIFSRTSGIFLLNFRLVAKRFGGTGLIASVPRETNRSLP